MNQPNESLNQPEIFTNAYDFSLHIETESHNTGRTCTDILLEYTDKYDIPEETIAKYVSASLKEKIRIDMQALGFLPAQTSQLEFD